MAALLGLLAAGAFGASDFAAGLASRHLSAAPVTVAAQFLGLLTAGAAVLLFSGVGARGSALEWGAVAGVGSAAGTLSLYHGLSVGRMSTVATLSAVITAVIPALVGVALGESLSGHAVVGIVLAVPAIALVSRGPGKHDGEQLDGTRQSSGAVFGLLAGLGFALLFIALDQAGTRSGAWPMVSDQGVSVMLVTPIAIRGLAGVAAPARVTVLLMLTAGFLSGTANLLFLAATGYGKLAVVAVLTAMYPAVTVLLARSLLAERWSRAQVAGLISAAVAVALVSLR